MDDERANHVISTLVANENTQMLVARFSAGWWHPRITTIVAKCGSTAMQKWVLSVGPWKGRKGMLKTGEIIINAGNLEMLKMHYTTKTLPPRIYEQLQMYAQRSPNPEIAVWLSNTYGNNQRG